MNDDQPNEAIRGAYFDLAGEGLKLQTEVLLEREKAIERLHYLAKGYAAGRDYTNVLVAVGYAVFGAFWAGTAHDIPAVARLISGGLLAVSLTLFIVWEVYKMWSNQREGVLLARAINVSRTREELAERVRDADRQIAVLDLMADRRWAFFFYPSLVCGLLGATILACSCLANGGYLLIN